MGRKPKDRRLDQVKDKFLDMMLEEQEPKTLCDLLSSYNSVLDMLEKEKALSKHGRVNALDGVRGLWRNIHDRCYNPKNGGYKNYGAKGIRVCSKWRDFRKFAEWCAENGYEPGLSIDRIDTTKDYEPENCRFLTKSEHAVKTTRDIVADNSKKPAKLVAPTFVN